MIYTVLYQPLDSHGLFVFILFRAISLKNSPNILIKDLEKWKDEKRQSIIALIMGRTHVYEPSKLQLEIKQIHTDEKLKTIFTNEGGSVLLPELNLKVHPKIERFGI